MERERWQPRQSYRTTSSLRNSQEQHSQGSTALPTSVVLFFAIGYGHAKRLAAADIDFRAKRALVEDRECRGWGQFSLRVCFRCREQLAQRGRAEAKNEFVVETAAGVGESFIRN